MSTTITVEISEDIKATVDKAAREEGLSEKAFVARAIKDYLFLRRFRKLREKMLAESDRSYSDEEIFDIVS
jgi:predicted transcriptional regulator